MRLLPNLATRPVVVAGEGMQAGECLVETEMGSADLGFMAQLAEIERGFFDRLGKHPAQAALSRAGHEPESKKKEPSRAISEGRAINNGIEEEQPVREVNAAGIRVKAIEAQYLDEPEIPRVAAAAGESDDEYSVTTGNHSDDELQDAQLERSVQGSRTSGSFR